MSPPAAPDLREAIEQVKERIEIETVIGRRVQLQRRGSQLIGLCPFHAEKTPSFHVTPDKGFFKCFGCGKGGDVLTFVQELDGLDFMEALRMLADDAGVDLPQQRLDRAARSRNQAAREALTLARRLYREQLGAPAGEDGRRYLADRGLQEELLEAFQVGWAPAEPGWLADRLRRAGIPPEAAEDAGLIYTPDGGGRPRDRFWDRVVFPVMDKSGKTVGFGGRYLPGSRAEERGMGKYVNSPDGPLFPKRRLLYGIDRLAAALRESAEDAPILICEGYLDVLMLHQAGLRCCVAALGTSLTEDHARALRRYDRPVALMLDPDEAGRRAAARAARLLVAEGVPVKVVELPDGLDPADMVAAGRTEELAQRLAEAWDILDWRLDAWIRKADFSDPTVQSRAAAEVAEWLGATPNPALREIWARRAGDRLGLTQETLHRMVRPSAGFAPRPGPPVPVEDEPAPRNPALEVLTRNEREVLTALLHDPSLFPRHRKDLEELELRDPVAAQVLKWCVERRKEGSSFELEQALTAFPDPEVRRWLDQVRLHRPADCARVIDAALRGLPGNRERLRSFEADRQPGAQVEGPSDERLASLQRRITIRSADDQD